MLPHECRYPIIIAPWHDLKAELEKVLPEKKSEEILSQLCKDRLNIATVPSEEEYLKRLLTVVDALKKHFDDVVSAKIFKIRIDLSTFERLKASKETENVAEALAVFLRSNNNAGTEQKIQGILAVGDYLNGISETLDGQNEDIENTLKRFEDKLADAVREFMPTPRSLVGKRLNKIVQALYDYKVIKINDFEHLDPQLRKDLLDIFLYF